MRSKMLIMLIFSSLLFLVVIVLGVNWLEPSYDADEMLTSEETDVISTSALETPWESRERQKNKSLLNETMPNIILGGARYPKESRATSQEVAEKIASAESYTLNTNTELPPNQTEASNVQGNWVFTLNDSMMREVQMTFFQNEADIYGSGKIKEGNNTQNMTASGTTADSTLELNLVSMNPIVRYNLNLSLGEDRATGTYQAYSAGGMWTGMAKGQKTP